MFEAIFLIPFLLSAHSNGATLSGGVGFAENEALFIDQIGILDIRTDIYTIGSMSISIGGSHISSIPDARDNFNDSFARNNVSALNVMSIKMSVKIGGFK